MRRLCVGGIYLCGVTAVLSVAGCISAHPGPAQNILRGPKNTISDEYAASREVNEVSRAIQAGGDTSMAIPRLLNIITRYPKSNAALDARYWLAKAYSGVSAYSNALQLYNEYIRLAPKGKYIKACIEEANKLDADYKKKYPSPEMLNAKVKTLTDQAQKNPNDLKTQLDLADALWRRGDYASAGTLYAEIVKSHPEFRTDLTVKSRVDFLPNGEYIVLSPDEVQRRAIEAQPLAVINTASFKSGPDSITQVNQFYSVTGQVVNRSDSVLDGVQVMVTIYGFGSVVYDTTSVNLGRLNPAEIKAFSVRFSNFDNIENVSRYECVATFQH